MTQAKRRYRGHEVEKYVCAHPNVELRITTIADAVEWSAASTGACLARLSTRHVELERVRRGVYRWNASTVGSQLAGGTLAGRQELLLSVVTVSDAGVALVRDEETHELFTVQPFKL
jgi:hypothetical protein